MFMLVATRAGPSRVSRLPLSRLVHTSRPRQQERFGFGLARGGTTSNERRSVRESRLEKDEQREMMPERAVWTAPEMDSKSRRWRDTANRATHMDTGEPQSESVTRAELTRHGIKSECTSQY